LEVQAAVQRRLKTAVERSDFYNVGSQGETSVVDRRWAFKGRIKTLTRVSTKYFRFYTRRRSTGA
jgi:hypothetical protein